MSYEHMHHESGPVSLKKLPVETSAVEPVVRDTGDIDSILNEFDVILDAVETEERFASIRHRFGEIGIRQELDIRQMRPLIPRQSRERIQKKK